jgi:hypothetical protein
VDERVAVNRLVTVVLFAVAFVVALVLGVLNASR